MSKGRRKTIVRIVEGTALALVLLDLTLYFALVRPLLTMRTEEEASYAAARERVRDLKARAARLEKEWLLKQALDKRKRSLPTSPSPPPRGRGQG